MSVVMVSADGVAQAVRGSEGIGTRSAECLKAAEPIVVCFAVKIEAAGGPIPGRQLFDNNASPPDASGLRGQNSRTAEKFRDGTGIVGATPAPGRALVPPGTKGDLISLSRYGGPVAVQSEVAPMPRKPTARKTRKSGQTRKTARRKTGRRWSARVTRTSDALTLDRGVFTQRDPKRIARSLKRSAERSRRRKADPYRS